MSIEKNKESATYPDYSKLTFEELVKMLKDAPATINTDFYCGIYDAVSLMDKPSQ